ncbi:MAG: hypothetical protein Q8941_16365 [Bacteroidota bacterium]|nr:hypothetical protein [Bacteroidota bacterium]
MITRLLLLLCTGCMTGCLSMDTKCCDFMGSYSISGSLYVEKYRTFCAGVFGERNDYYLTDSVKFRKYIGSSDEHNTIRILQKDSIIHLYTLASRIITDTIGQKSVSRFDLINKQRFDSNNAKAIPLFGTNQIPCNNFLSYSSHEFEKGFFMTIDQFQCGSTYLNAVYITDSSTFRKLIGFYDSGSNNPSYSIKVNNNEFIFYQTRSRSVIDTTNHETFKLSEFLPGRLEKVCERK